MSRVHGATEASTAADTVRDDWVWYNLPDPFALGSVFIGVNEYSYPGQLIRIPDDSTAAIIFPADAEDAGKATKNFSEFCTNVKEHPVRAKVKAISMQHVALTDETLAGLKCLTPLNHLDLRGHRLTPEKLVAIYKVVGASCQLLIDPNNRLLSVNEERDFSSFVVPAGSLKDVSIADFLRFLRRVHLVDVHGLSYWSLQMKELVLNDSSASLDMFEQGGDKLLPVNVTTLVLDNNHFSYFAENLWKQMSAIHHLSLRKCSLGIADAAALFFVHMPQLAKLNVTRNDLSVVAYMQCQAYLPEDGRFVSDGYDGLTGRANIYQRKWLLHQGYGVKHRQVIMHRAAPSESKAEDAKVNAATVHAISDYLCLVRDCMSDDRYIANPSLPVDLKRTTLFAKVKSYRRLPESPFVGVPTRLMRDLTALLGHQSELSQDEFLALVERIYSAQAVVASQVIEKRPLGVKTLFEAPITVERLLKLRLTLGEHQRKVMASYEHYTTKAQGKASIKKLHAGQILAGIYMAMGAVMSMIDRAGTGAAPEMEMTLTAADAERMLGYCDMMMADELVEVVEEDAVALGASAAEAKLEEGAEDSDASVDHDCRVFDGTGWDTRRLVP